MRYPQFEDTGGLYGNTGVGLTVPHPATVNAGDWLFLVFGKDYTSSTTISIPPSGYTYGLSISSFALKMTFYLYWRKADGTEDLNNVNIQWAEVPVTATAGEIFRYSNVVTDTPYWDFDSNASGEATSATIKGGTTTGNGRLLINFLFILGVDNNTKTPCATASGWSESVYNFINSGNDIGIKTQERQVTSAGVIGDSSSSFSGNTRKHIGLTIGLIHANWPHDFLGVANASIGEINTVSLEDINAVNTIE